ncbi:MAG TPA: hypothetical protein VKD23_18035, partial [Terriglobales bacterium]|nr:hypothetical protein [Terriglobales bacterium]
RRGVRTTRLLRPQVSALVFSATCVHRIPPRVRDDREPPLEWDETKSLYSCFYLAVKHNF